MAAAAAAAAAAACVSGARFRANSLFFSGNFHRRRAAEGGKEGRRGERSAKTFFYSPPPLPVSRRQFAICHRLSTSRDATPVGYNRVKWRARLYDLFRLRRLQQVILSSCTLLLRCCSTDFHRDLEGEKKERR